MKMKKYMNVKKTKTKITNARVILLKFYDQLFNVFEFKIVDKIFFYKSSFQIRNKRKKNNQK